MKKIIFDLDGTLLYLDGDCKSAYKKVIDKFNLNISPNELYDYIDEIEDKAKNTIVTKSTFCEFLNKRFNLTITDEILNELLKEYASVPLKDTNVIYDLLSCLSKKYELIAYSNWFYFNQIERLKKYNLDKFFACIYGWDTIESKPSIIAINKIIKDDDISDFIYVGDSISKDLEIPRKMGMKVIFLNTRGINQNTYQEIYKIEELKQIL